jgi:hypothetical protein
MVNDSETHILTDEPTYIDDKLTIRAVNLAQISKGRSPIARFGH